MDICFKAFQHETTGTMVAAATHAPTARTRPAVQLLPSSPIAYGDFALLPWAWFAFATTVPPFVLQGDLDVAA